MMSVKLNMKNAWQRRADKDVSYSCTSTPPSWKTATWNHFLRHPTCAPLLLLHASQLYRERMQLMIPSTLSHPPPEAQRMIAIFSLFSDLRRQKNNKKTGMTLSMWAAAVSGRTGRLCCIFSRSPSVLCKVQGVSQEREAGRLAGLEVIRGWLSGPQHRRDVCARPPGSHTEPFMSALRGNTAASHLTPPAPPHHHHPTFALALGWMNVTAVCVNDHSSPVQVSPFKQTGGC